MAAVRAKFTVIEATVFAGNPDHRRVVLAPMYDTSIPEHQRFASATPSGRLEMYLTNPKAADVLVPGAAFYVDFTPVPPTAG